MRPRADDALNMKGKSAAAQPAAKNPVKPASKLDPDVLPPRFEFGAGDDFQLKQALNELKGQPVLASNKAVAAQAKPQ